jgi:ABC-type sugar transport system permease subunit
MLRRQSSILREKRISFYLFIGLWLLGFLVFQLMPIIWGFANSLTNRMAFSLVIKFVGFQNYKKLLTDPEILYSFYTTFIYTISSTTVAVLFGLIFALLLERDTPARGLFRTLLYLPYVIPLVAVGWIFRLFLERETGFLNVLLLNLGVISANVGWLQQFPRESIIALALWRAGWSMIIFLGGLSTVPRELYEVASIDGARYFKRLTRITLPMISPFIFFQFVVSFIYSMQQFIQPYIMNPRPIRGTNVTMTPPPQDTFFVMSRAFFSIINQNRLAYGLSMLWILFFIVLIITVLFIKFGGFWVYTETEDKR